MKLKRLFQLAGTILLIFTFSCKKETTAPTIISESEIKTEVDSLLNLWHQAAAKANFESYFGSMTTDAIFIGTDATENWNIAAFKEFSKPYFDRGTAWDFKSLERNVFVSEDRSIVWFDELLDTWMGICRGSGVIKKENDQWKITNYVLSPTVPNDDIQPFIELKKDTDSITIKKLKQKN